MTATRYRTRPRSTRAKPPPRPERAVGNLNHGYIVIWYDAKLPAADVKILQSASAGNTRTLVVPWTRNVFSGNQHVVLTAWDRTQRCTKSSAKVISAFAATYRDADASGQGWASPSAPTPNGSAGTPAPGSPSPSPSPSPNPSPTPATSTSPIPVPAPSPIPSTTYSPAPTPGASLPRVTVTPIR